MGKKKLSVVAITLGHGGAERVISLLLPSLAKDFDTTLVLFYDIVHFEIPEGVHKVVLLSKAQQSGSILKKITGMFTIIARYNKFIRNNSIEISMSFLALPNIINGIIAMRNKRLKTIISERCFPSLMYKYNKFSMFLVKIAFPLFYNRNSKLFSNSIHINEDLRQNFRVTLPMSVIYNPIVMDARKKDVKNAKTTSPLKIINVGTLYGPKNQQLLLQALAQLNRNEFFLTVLGEGPFENDLRAQIVENKLEAETDFKGRVPNVKEHLIENDCFVLSSNNEGFPNVLLEAMSVGLPSISTNCMSGPLELLNNNEPVDIAPGAFYKAKYGILINVNDAKGLASALMYFKNHPEERKKYSTLSIQKAKEFELPNIYKQVKNLITN